MKGPVLNLNTKPAQRNFTVFNRHFSFLANIKQSQMDQFRERIIAWIRSLFHSELQRLLFKDSFELDA